MADDDRYSGIVVTKDGTCYRLGADGWPVEYPPDEDDEDEDDYSPRIGDGKEP